MIEILSFTRRIISSLCGHILMHGCFSELG